MNILSSSQLISSDSLYAVFTMIRQHAPITRQFISERLHIPSTTLNRLFDKLVSSGLIVESGLAQSTGGRPASLYTVSDNKIFFLGLDVSSAESKLVLTNLMPEIVTSIGLPGMTQTTPEKLAESALKAVESMMVQFHLSLNRVAGLGICQTTFSENQPNTMTLYHEKLKTLLNKNLDIPVSLIDADDAALYAGLWLDHELDNQTLFYFSAGHQLRSGLVPDGQFSMNYLKSVSADGLLVPDKTKSSYSDLEAIATPKAMIEQFRKSKKSNKEDWSSFCKAASQGKKKAGAVLEETAEAVAIAIYNALYISSSSYLLLDGSSFDELPVYREKIISKLKMAGTRLRFVDQSQNDTGIKMSEPADQKTSKTDMQDETERSDIRIVTILENRYKDNLSAVGSASYMLTHYLGLSAESSG